MAWNDDFNKYTGKSARFQKSRSEGDTESDIKVRDSDIGRNMDFKRIAVHHVAVAPYSRTSSPHAESLEEEFVFVISGEVHLWLNGYIHKLTKGHAVGFPAGTGIAHTFINNSDEEVQLLVAGERTKAENLCVFPINPELKADCDIWWSNPPSQELGPHSGLPGPVGEHEWAVKSDSCIFFCSGAERGKPFHYPGNNETFGEGVRITDKVGLKALGIWYEFLPPGRRSAFPHAHTHEDEFVFVFKGKPTLWIDGWTRDFVEGEFAAFPSGTGLAHTIINDTNEDVVYLCIGETENFKDEKLNYPLNPLRNKEGERKGWLWRDVPPPNLGAHNGKPQKPFQEHLSFRSCSENDVIEVLDIFKKSPNYFLKVDGCEPNEKMAKLALIDGPKNTNPKYFKEFLVIDYKDQPIGVLDLHPNHPEEGICYLGLLLIDESHFGRGLGRKCYELAEDYIKRALDCKKIKLGISDENDVSGFWSKMGFEFNGKTYEWKGEEKTANVREFEKVLEGAK